MKREKQRKGEKGCACHGAPTESVQVNTEHFTLRKKREGLNTESSGKTLLSPVGNRHTHKQPLPMGLKQPTMLIYHDDKWHDIS